MAEKEISCCKKATDNSKKGIFLGILYGLIPHSFCIAFAIFSIIGAITAAALLKKFLLIPNFSYFLVFASLLLATVSSAAYLKRNGCLCKAGLKSKWKYVVSLYSATILVNFLVFFVVFPALANIDSKKPAVQSSEIAAVSLNVKIPCSGHAALIIDEIKKDKHVRSVEFRMPDKFEIKYDPKETSPEKIASLEIFKTYGATIN